MHHLCYICRSPELGLVKSLSKEGSSLIRALSGLPRLGRGDKTRSGGLLGLLGKGKEAAVSEPIPDPLVCSVHCSEQEIF